MQKINPDIIRLEDILLHIKNIEEFNVTPEKGRAEVFAIAYCVAIIGEAASKLSADLRKVNSNIEWHQIIGTRNKIIHEYGKLNEARLWDIVNTHLPILKNEIATILEKLIKSS